MHVHTYNLLSLGNREAYFFGACPSTEMGGGNGGQEGEEGGGGCEFRVLSFRRWGTLKSFGSTFLVTLEGRGGPRIKQT